MNLFKNTLIFSFIISLLLTILTSFLFINGDFEKYSYLITMKSESFNILGFYLSNFNHTGIVHFLFNFLFFYQIFLLTRKSKISNHYFYLFLLSFFVTPILTYILMSITRTEFILLGLSGVLFSFVGFTLGNLIKYTKTNVSFLILYHFIFLYIGVNIGWEAHLCGYLVGVFYLFYFKLNNKTFIININELLNEIRITINKDLILDELSIEEEKFLDIKQKFNIYETKNNFQYSIPLSVIFYLNNISFNRLKHETIDIDNYFKINENEIYEQKPDIKKLKKILNNILLNKDLKYKNSSVIFI